MAPSSCGWSAFPSSASRWCSSRARRPFQGHANGLRAGGRLGRDLRGRATARWSVRRTDFGGDAPGRGAWRRLHHQPEPVWPHLAVQVQAEAADRSRIDDIYRFYVRNVEGKMIPLRSLAEPRVVVGPPALIRSNNLRAVAIQGGPAPGVSPVRRFWRSKRSRPRRCRKGMRENGRIRHSRRSAEGKTAIILGFAVLFAYLLLVALSWTIPVFVKSCRRRRKHLG
jgi:hypothetical protein